MAQRGPGFNSQHQLSSSQLTPLLASSGTRHKHATGTRSGKLLIHIGSKATTIKYATWEGSLEASELPWILQKSSKPKEAKRNPSQHHKALQIMAQVFSRMCGQFYGFPRSSKEFSPATHRS